MPCFSQQEGKSKGWAYHVPDGWWSSPAKGAADDLGTWRRAAAMASKSSPRPRERENAGLINRRTGKVQGWVAGLQDGCQRGTAGVATV